MSVCDFRFPVRHLSVCDFLFLLETPVCLSLRPGPHLVLFVLLQREASAFLLLLSAPDAAGRPAPPQLRARSHGDATGQRDPGTLAGLRQVSVRDAAGVLGSDLDRFCYPLCPCRSRVYTADLESALHFLLRVELATHATLQGEELKVFKDFVTLVAKVQLNSNQSEPLVSNPEPEDRLTARYQITWSTRCVLRLQRHRVVGRTGTSPGRSLCAGGHSHTHLRLVSPAAVPRWRLGGEADGDAL